MFALQDLKVVELCCWHAGPYCGKLLADLGAEVIKIEPPSGDPARREGPFPQNLSHPECSGAFLYLNTNKLGITLDMETRAGQKIFRGLVEQADILLEDLPPGKLGELGLGYDSFAESNPRLILVSITPFGQTGPYRDFKAYPINTFHAGGEGYTLPGALGWILYSDRPPLNVAGLAGEHYAGLMAASASMTALAARFITGRGQHVDVSKQEALLNLNRCEIEEYPNHDFIEQRATRMHPIGGLLQCQDGFVVMSVFNDSMWEGLVELMGNPEWAANEEYATRAGRNADGGVISSYIADWMLAHTKEEIYREGQARGVAITPILTPEEVYASQQLRARNYFVEVEHPKAGKVLMPSTPYRFSRTPGPLRPAPLLGQHNREIICERLGYRDEDLVLLRAAGAV